VVLGGWIVKILVFIGLLALITRLPFIEPHVLFGCIVAAVLGSVAADSWAAMRARVPYVDD
jgi:Ca2+/Na+ antiporter